MLFLKSVTKIFKYLDHNLLLKVFKTEGFGGKIKKHLGTVLTLFGILLFLGSLLGLANTLIWSEESLPYRLGSILVLVSIGLIVAGCVIGVRGLLRRSREKREISGPKHVCRECGRELKNYPEDVDICSRCHKRIEERKREILFLGRVRLIRVLLGVMILITLAPNLLSFLMFVFTIPFAFLLAVVFFLLPMVFPLIVSIYLIKSKKSRLFSEAILTGLSSIIPLITASPGLFLKKFLPITTLDELFLIMPYVTSTLILTATIFIFTVSLTKRVKRISVKTASIIVLVSTLLPFAMVMLAPTQPSPGPMITVSISGGGNWLTWDSSSNFPPGFLEYDETSRLWIYRISLASPLQNPVIINGVSFDSQFSNAPFSENIGCEGLEKTSEGIVFQPGARGKIIITLEQPFNKITLFDNMGNAYRLIW